MRVEGDQPFRSVSHEVDVRTGPSDCRLCYDRPVASFFKDRSARIEDSDEAKSRRTCGACTLSEGAAIRTREKRRVQSEVLVTRLVISFYMHWPLIDWFCSQSARQEEEKDIRKARYIMAYRTRRL